LLLPIVRKLRTLTGQERWLLVEATLGLGVSRLLLLTVPFRFIAPRLGIQTTKPSVPPMNLEPAPAASELERIGWAVRAMARRTPWESACLAQAMTAKVMLRRRSLPSSLFLGLAKDENSDLQAHAWLSCGSTIVTGGEEHHRFTIMSSFNELSSK